MGLLDYIEARRLERERAIRNEKAANLAKIVASVGVGFALGMLFAPKSGKKTREDLANAAKEGLDFVSENVNNAIKVIKDKSSELKEAATEKAENISEKIEDVKEKVKEKAKDIKEKSDEKEKSSK